MRRMAHAAAKPTPSPATTPIEIAATNRPPCRAARSSGSSIQSMNPSTSRIATGSLKPASASSVRASRRRRVEVRSSEKMAAPSVAARIDPSSSPSSVDRSKSQIAANAGDRSRADRGEHREHQPGPQHGPDLGEARDQAALEEDGRQGDDPHPARELVVVELDPPGAVRADDHPEAQEEEEAGHAEAPGEQGGGQRGGQQRTCDEDELAVAHLSPGLTSTRPELCRSRPGASALPLHGFGRS